MVALLAWDGQVGGTGCGQGRQGKHRLLLVVFASGPQPGFANLETIELRRDTTSGSVGGSSHFKCVCPVGLFVLVLKLRENQVRVPHRSSR